MPRTMKALVKAEARAGPVDGRRAGADDRRERRADPHQEDARSAAPTSTSTTGTSGRRRRSRCRWSSATSTSASIEEVGSDVVDYKPGDRVTGEGHITCGHCRNCRAGRRHLCRKTLGVGVNRPGCFGEFLSLPAGNAFKLPERDLRRLGGDLRSVRQRRRTRRSRST